MRAEENFLRAEGSHEPENASKVNFLRARPLFDRSTLLLASEFESRHHQIREVVIWADQGSSLVSYRCLGYHLMSGDRLDGQYSIYV
jgi:hypothetical protein